jgi:hypothetical protein
MDGWALGRDGRTDTARERMCCQHEAQSDKRMGENWRSGADEGDLVVTAATKCCRDKAEHAWPGQAWAGVGEERLEWPRPIEGLKHQQMQM